MKHMDSLPTSRLLVKCHVGNAGNVENVAIVLVSDSSLPPLTYLTHAPPYPPATPATPRYPRHPYLPLFCRMDFDLDTRPEAVAALTQLSYPCPGSPLLGARVAAMLRGSGFPCR